MTDISDRAEIEDRPQRRLPRSVTGLRNAPTSSSLGAPRDSGSGASRPLRVLYLDLDRFKM